MVTRTRGIRKLETAGVVHERAYAKVNLALDVLGRRTDGYHDLRSVMQTISLHDSLSFSLEPNSSVATEEPGDFSLIDRAIDLVRDHAGFASPVYYRLTKRIPVAAGLGGGSSDAAAALVGAAKLLGLAVEPSIAATFAAELGSDVPFFLKGGTALIEGRGERVTPLEPLPERWIVLVNMNEAVSTATVFSRWSASDRGDRRSVERVTAALKNKRVVVGDNDLWAAASGAFPSIAEAQDILLKVARKDSVGMAGSGGTMFALFDNEAEAVSAWGAVAQAAPWSQVAHFVHPRPR